MVIDQLITAFDTGLRTVFAKAQATRTRPDVSINEPDLTQEQKSHAASLMRVNHVGEVCAQALYNGQALTSRNPYIAQSLQQAANEELDHLAWCENRIEELGGRKSLLNPFWYTASFAIGAVAGAISDRLNLSFLAETEQQVAAHLENHLVQLSPEDTKTRAILDQIKSDETTHAAEAQALGANALPEPVKLGMKLASKIMTTTAYYI